MSRDSYPTPEIAVGIAVALSMNDGRNRTVIEGGQMAHRRLICVQVQGEPYGGATLHDVLVQELPRDDRGLEREGPSE